MYSYNPRDDWRHDIVVEKIIPAEPGVAYPPCTGGRSGSWRGLVVAGRASCLNRARTSTAFRPDSLGRYRSGDSGAGSSAWAAWLSRWSRTSAPRRHRRSTEAWDVPSHPPGLLGGEAQLIFIRGRSS
jgi:hypothetical protein